MPKQETGSIFPEWDYLIITASSSRQAEAYQSQLALRESLGLIHGARRVIVISDPGGKRVGSGGSTLHCLLNVLNRELRSGRDAGKRSDPRTWSGIFDKLRILIVHAGGDSRRLPPYGPCGKVFVPVPGKAGGAAGTAVFDRLIPAYLKLPRPATGGGQVVVTSGDVLLDFDAASVVFGEKAVTGVGALVSPELAKNHGVYCPDEAGKVRLFLQKPSLREQARVGAINSHGQSVLDIGILNFSPEAVVRLLELCGVAEGSEGRRILRWGGPLAEEIELSGLDVYREICCALGREIRWDGYLDQVRAAGSSISERTLRKIFQGLRPLPFRVHVIPRFRFLHFGTLRELIDSGQSLIDSETAGPARDSAVIINSRLSGHGAVKGQNAWVEGCRIEASLTLAGDNAVIGLDVEAPLALPRGGSIDVLGGKGRDGRKGWFIRAYRIEDVFHLPAEKGGSLGGLPIHEWLSAFGADWDDIWPAKRPRIEPTVWNGRFFPIVRDKGAYRDWLWLIEPGKASPRQKAEWLGAERYSLEEMALRADLDAFFARRLDINGELARESLASFVGPDGEISAEELAFMIARAPAGQRTNWIIAIARQTVRSWKMSRLHNGIESLEHSRVLHTAGTVLKQIAGNVGIHRRAGDAFQPIQAGLTRAERRAFYEMGAPLEKTARLEEWAEDLREAAFWHLGGTIIHRGGRAPAPPKSVLRSDEIVWGRAPARLDLGGGWTDTPPYSLERGGCVINAAVDLNGQAPIQAYARIIEKPEIRINSIDYSTRVVVKTLKDLLDYGKPGSQFALAKAALALAGFSPEAAAWPAGVKTLEGMLRRFGGGIELTTLAAIPGGSGLGTSSIMGAVLMSVIGRIVGRPLSSRELFHAVLKLEQELTTGGGWQDQIGGAVEGVKMIEAEKGLVPDPRIHFVPGDLLDPTVNGGRTLLYYTGLRRLAKDILHEVVGRYLDRDRAAMETLRRLHAFPPIMADAMAMRDESRFGELIEIAWKLNVDLDPDHTTPMIEELRARIKPHVLGSKLLGAGGGGFLLMVCKTPEDAAVVRRMLEENPPNDRARFFDYSINKTGLVVTVC